MLFLLWQVKRLFVTERAGKQIELLLPEHLQSSIKKKKTFADSYP